MTFYFVTTFQFIFKLEKKKRRESSKTQALPGEKKN